VISLNERAWRLCDELAANAERLNAVVTTSAGGARLIDCGVNAVGGLEAGRLLAEICLSGLGDINIGLGSERETNWPLVTMHTDQPLLACLASQYAGWQISGEKFFAMGSGPMRAVACREPLFEQLQLREQSDRVVGVLETSKLPPDEICRKIAEQCGVTPDRVTVVLARTASLAGTVQVVARSVETALHKLHEVGYDLKLRRCPAAAGCGGRSGGHRPNERRRSLRRRSDIMGPR
jgi:methenyltetrahydromethanopterin cyclohydrolase